MSDQTGGWTFLTNHAHVLLCIARDPDLRLRDIAAAVGVTERAVQLIVADLEEAGYLTRTRVGRRNRYQLHRARPLRHPVERGHDVDELLAALVPPGEAPGEALGATEDGTRAQAASRLTAAPSP